MISAEFLKFNSSESDLESLINQILSDSALSLAAKNKLTAEAFAKIIRRSLGKTGSVIFRALKKDLGSNALGLEPLRVHPSGGIMQDTIKKYRPSTYGGPRFDRVLKSRTKRNPGGKFKNLMQYYLSKSGEILKIGLIPERRGGDKWAKRFQAWQEAGEIDKSEFYNFNLSGMYSYLRALGMPVTSMPRRPKRDVIDSVDAKYKPVDVFRKALIERLTK